MKRIATNLAAVLLSLAPAAALAHPGHGSHDHDGGYTIIHYFTQPSHVLLNIAVLFITVMVIRNLRRMNQKA